MLGIIGVILPVLAIPVFIVGVIMLIVQAIRKKRKKSSLITIITSVYMFVLGFVLFYVGSTGDKASVFLSSCILAIVTLVIGIIHLLVVVVRKRNKKPAFVTLILAAVIFVVGLVSYLIPNSVNKPDVEEHVRGIVLEKYNPLFNDNINSVDVKVLDIDEDDDTYTVKGKVTVLDDFRDKYVGKFVIVLQYIEGSGFTEKSVNIETPVKSK